MSVLFLSIRAFFCICCFINTFKCFERLLLVLLLFLFSQFGASSHFQNFDKIPDTSPLMARHGGRFKRKLIVDSICYMHALIFFIIIIIFFFAHTYMVVTETPSIENGPWGRRASVSMNNPSLQAKTVTSHARSTTFTPMARTRKNTQKGVGKDRNRKQSKSSSNSF